MTPRVFEGRVLASSPVEPDAPIPILTHNPSSGGLHVMPADDPPNSSINAAPARRRFQQAVRRVVQSRAMVQQPENEPERDGSSQPPTQRQATAISVPDSVHPGHSRRAQSAWYLAPGAMRPPRISFLIPALRQLRATQYIDAHHGLVRHLQFSPDGKWLATCSWDRTAIIWKVGDPFSQHRVLSHGSAGFVGQVAWSPSGTQLLTKLLRSVRVWNPEVRQSPYYTLHG